MLRLAVDVESATLGMTTSLVVLLPQRQDIADWGAPTPGPHGPGVLYLLHGLSDDASCWSRFTSLERYAAAAGLAVVMPEVGRSMYVDAPGGLPYFSYVADELPQLVAAAFRVSTRREDTFVAGLSMGGYGALKLALRRPGRYAAAASLSGVLDIGLIEDGERFTPAQLASMFGPAGSGVGTPDDVRVLLRATATAGTGPSATPAAEPSRPTASVSPASVSASSTSPVSLPQLYLSCGTSDHLYGANLAFEDLARELGVPLTVEHRPGDHTWDFWDAGIARVLAWLPRSPVRP